MKRIVLLFLTTFILISLHAQKSDILSPSYMGNIITIEKKMKRVGYQLLGDTIQENRIKGARELVKLLVEALKFENSFQYKFDSLPFIAKAYPEDSGFRIFTLQVMLDNYTFIHYGAIQLNRKNLKLIPFRDYSDTFSTTPKGVLSNRNWPGAIYYKIFTKKVDNKPLYFLFGYDQNDVLSDKKYIEPMQIFGDTLAKFGYPIFEKTEPIPLNQAVLIDPKTRKPLPQINKNKPKMLYRFVMEYRKGGTATLQYDKEKDRILMEHLAPIDGKSYEVGFMKLPDGSYEGFLWKNNKWVWQEMVTVSEKDDNRIIQTSPKKNDKKVPLGN